MDQQENGFRLEATPDEVLNEVASIDRRVFDLAVERVRSKKLEERIHQMMAEQDKSD